MRRLAFAAFCCAPIVAFAQAPGQLVTSVAESPPASRSTPTVATATRAAQPPVLDGRTEDAIWRQAQVIDQFLEYEPNEGAETRFKTEARVAYDDRYLYVLVRMFDPAPDSIVSLLARRDVRVSSEHVKLLIDSYHDRRTAYQFAVNPAGVKRDYYVYNDNVEDASWDAVWDVGTAIDSLGWVAEFRIPFSQLRFANKADHTFGLMIVRDVQRTGARISWPLYHRTQQGYVSQAGEIGGIRAIPSPRRLEVMPYVVTKNVTEAERDNASSITGYTHPQQVTGGADIKYGLSSNLTLDATINPDFGQVEADPAVLNLSAFETFFAERRPFFLEGTGIFSFRVNCGDIDTDCTGLLHSRRIGRNPQLGEEGDPTATTILGAAKLTGRLGNGLSVGVLDALTQREAGAENLTIEPRTNYAIGRLQQDLRKGNSGIGLMLTSVNRNLDAYTDPLLSREAYSGGTDLRHRFFKNNYELAGMLSGSIVRGDAAAIARVQRNGVHRFQRPDDDVEYDPARTSLRGDAQRVSVSKFGGGITRFQTVYQRYSPGFEINDVGFLSRADEQLFRNWFALNLTKPKYVYRRAFLNFNTWTYWTSEGLPTNLGVNSNWHVEFRNQWWGHVGFNAGNFLGRTYSDRDARGGPAIRRSPDSDLWAGFEMDPRKKVTAQFFTGFWNSDAGKSDGWWLEPGVQFRASSRFSASVGVYYERAINDNQWRDNFGTAGVDTTHYTFARLDQTTLNVNTRLNFTATPDLSLQIYARPFISNGDYSDWRELNDPRAEQYDARYKPFLSQGDPGGFDFKQFNSTSVLRWEYRPGSTLFFVWQQGRLRDADRSGEFSFRRDYEDLFALHPDNTFLIKASYWFNY